MIRIATFPAVECSNPYLALYYRALEAHGCVVTCTAKLENRFLREHHAVFDILHIHWTHEILWRGWGTGRLARIRGLVGELRFLWALWRLGKPLVWTAHDLEPLDRTSFSDRLGNRLLVRASDLVICHTESTRDQLVRHYRGKKSKTVVMPIGNYDGVFPPPRPRAETLAKLNLDPGKPVLLAAGIVRPYKGFDLAIEAAHKLGPNFQLVIAGDVYKAEPEQEAQLRAAANSLPNVRLLLRVLGDDELADLYAAADCVLLPYRWITGSAALLVSLTFGRGVVASDLPFFREGLAGEPLAGVLVRPNDVDALAAGVKEFFAGDVSARHSAARRVADRVPWSEVVKPVAERLHALVPNRRLVAREAP